MRSTLSSGQCQFFEQLVADVFTHGQRIEQRALLKHHAEVGAHVHQIVFVHVVDALAVDENSAGVRLEQPEISRRIVDLPAPLAPRKIFVWPGLQREAHVAQDDFVVERE